MSLSHSGMELEHSKYTFHRKFLEADHIIHFLITVMVFSSLQKNKECTFGDKCRFSHNVEEYMASKPADIGERCYLYDTFGKCGYGLTCRFAKAHTTPDFKTMENADLVKAYEGRTGVKNSLDKDLQNGLRKRSVAFKKSEEYLKTLVKIKDKREQCGNGKNIERILTTQSLRGTLDCFLTLLANHKSFNPLSSILIQYCAPAVIL